MKSPSIHFALTLVVAIVASGMYYGWYATVSRKSEDSARLEQQIGTASANSNRVAAARSALAEISGDENMMRSYFVSDADVVSFISDLESLGSVSNAVVRVLSVSTAGTTARPTLRIALTITGTFNAVMRTIGAVEYVPYAISVSALAIGQDAANMWHADLNVTVGSISKTVSVPPNKNL